MGRKKQTIRAAHRRRLHLLGQRLAELRLQRGETVMAVAAAVQVSPEVIAAIEQGTYEQLQLLLLLRLCAHYGVRAEEVVKGKE